MSPNSALCSIMRASESSVSPTSNCACAHGGRGSSRSEAAMESLAAVAHGPQSISPPPRRPRALGPRRRMGAPVPAAAPPAAADEAASAGMWDLSDLYPSPESWAEAYARVQAAARALEGYKGTLGQSATAMLSALDAISAARRESIRLLIYA